MSTIVSFARPVMNNQPVSVLIFFDTSGPEGGGREGGREGRREGGRSERVMERERERDL